MLFCKIVYLAVLSYWPYRLRPHDSRGVVTRQIVVLVTELHLLDRGDVGYSQSRSSPRVLGPARMRTGDVPESMLSLPVPARSIKGGAASALSRCISMKRRPDQTDSQSSRLTRKSTPMRAMMSGISYPSPVEAAFVAHARHEPGTSQVIVHQATSAEADDQVNTCQHEDDENEGPAQ